MNIRDALLKEEIHTKAQALAIAHYSCTSDTNFNELIDCFLSNEYRIAQRAAWSVSWAAKEKPEMILPYIGVLVQQMQRKDAHPAIVRNSVRILEKIMIPEAFHGEVMDTCFGFVESPQTPIAIKAFALTTLFNLSKIYPEIKQELTLIIENQIDKGSPAFKSRAKKILQQLNKHGKK